MSLNQNAVGKMTNYRWTICAMLFFATTVNYLDRQVLSLTWDEFIKPEFHWMNHTTEQSLLFSLLFMQSACCSPVALSTGWVQRKVSFGLSVYGRQVLVSTLFVVS